MFAFCEPTVKIGGQAPATYSVGWPPGGEAHPGGADDAASVSEESHAAITDSALTSPKKE
jgi:hypothetical protein